MSRCNFSVLNADQINKSQLNSSPSKFRYSFSKDDRFAKISSKLLFFIIFLAALWRTITLMMSEVNDPPLSDTGLKATSQKIKLIPHPLIIMQNNPISIN